MKIKNKIISLILAALMTSAFISCESKSSSSGASIPAGGSGGGIGSVLDRIEDDENAQTPSADDQDKQPSDESVSTNVDSPFRSPLTGLPCEEYILTKRPMAIMINNIKNAIPQLGISEAEIMYECIVEGGITRLLMVVSGYEKLPELGSVRSSRDYYLDLAQAHDAIYAHCGGSDFAYTTIAQRRIDNIDGVNGSAVEGATYWKDPERVANMGYEHASMTNGTKLAEAVSAMGFRTEIKEGFNSPLAFADTETAFDGTDAVSVTVNYSNYAQSFFDYDSVTGQYKKGQFGAPHIDANTNQQLSFENVIILGSGYTNTNDAYNHLILSFTGSGKGYYVSNGIAKNIVWKKADRLSPYTLYEEDGTTPLLLNPGKSYIGITNGLSCVTFAGSEN